MTDLTPTPATLVRSAREVRGWSRKQLADASGIAVEVIAKLEDEGQAELRTLHALSTTLEIPVHRLAASARMRREQVALWVVIGLAFLLLLSLSAGYRFGKDAALRDNARDCIAAGRTDCAP